MWSVVFDMNNAGELTGRQTMNKILSVAVVLLGSSCNVFAGEVDVSGLRVVEPSAEVAERLGLEGFYAKCVMVDGFAIISSGKVDDYALLEAAYEDAMGKGLWKGKYAGTNRAEYWAEAVQSYFDDNRQPDHDHNHVNTRKELFEYDPALAGLVEEVFGDHPWRYKKPALRDEDGRKHLKGYSGKNAPTFRWSAELVKWYRDYEAEKRKKKGK